MNDSRTCQKVRKLMTIASDKYNRKCDQARPQRLLAKQYERVLKNTQKKHAADYKETVLDKKMESIERIESRKIERQLVLSPS